MSIHFRDILGADGFVFSNRGIKNTNILFRVIYPKTRLQYACACVIMGIRIRPQGIEKHHHLLHVLRRIYEAFRKRTGS